MSAEAAIAHMSIYAYVIKRCAELGQDPFVIRGKSRLREHVRARQKIAEELRAFGHSYQGIGRAINRHHASVMHLLGALSRRGFKP